MIYIDDDFIKNFLHNNLGENEWRQQPLDGMINLNSWEDNEDDYEEDEASNALALDFACRYIKKVLPLTTDFYPQFRTKKAKLKEQLLQDGKDSYLAMCSIHAHYFEGVTNSKIDKSDSVDISIQHIDLFVHNSALDCLLENYDAWFKKKISFENIYVECFCAGAYVKHIHNLLKSMLHEFFPAMNHLSLQQLDEAYSSLITEAWFAYFTLTDLDPDELNDSTVLLNLEDYEFETLLRWPGPKIEKSPNGKVTRICIYRNKPNPDTIPKLCTQCKSYYNRDEITGLCTVNRFDQRNSSHFKCGAYEKK